MDQTEQKSNKVVWLIVGAFVILALIVGAILYFALTSSKKNDNTTPVAESSSSSSQVSVATKDQVKQNLTDLNAAIKQAATDQAAAKAALSDGQHQVKLGS